MRIPVAARVTDDRMTALASIAYADIRDLPDAELALLSDDERERHFESTERRRQFLSGRLLARRMLQRQTGAPPASHRIRAGDHGKPYCAGGPPLSITHAGGLVAWQDVEIDEAQAAVRFRRELERSCAPPDASPAR